jgi:hypothetical protein
VGDWMISTRLSTLCGKLSKSKAAVVKRDLEKVTGAEFSTTAFIVL